MSNPKDAPSTGQANYICHTTGEYVKEKSCFFCGYQDICDRKEQDRYIPERDETGAYPKM